MSGGIAQRRLACALMRVVFDDSWRSSRRYLDEDSRVGHGALAAPAAVRCTMRSGVVEFDVHLEVQPIDEQGLVEETPARFLGVRQRLERAQQSLRI